MVCPLSTPSSAPFRRRRLSPLDAVVAFRRRPLQTPLWSLVSVPIGVSLVSVPLGVSVRPSWCVPPAPFSVPFNWTRAFPNAFYSGTEPRDSLQPSRRTLE
jgi:hypothetical protein